MNNTSLAIIPVMDSYILILPGPVHQVLAYIGGDAQVKCAVFNDNSTFVG